MTGDQARQLIALKFISEWEIAFPTMEIFMAGISEPDLTTQKETFITFGVGAPSVDQASLGINPLRRNTGVVELGLYVPQGSGTKQFFQMIDVATASLAIQNIGEIRMHSVTTIERQSAIGWQSREVLVNYSFDSSN